MIVTLSDECLECIRSELKEYGVTSKSDIKAEMGKALWNRVKPLSTIDVVDNIINSPETGIKLLRRSMIVSSGYLSEIWFYSQYWERVYRSYGKGLSDSDMLQFMEYLKDRLTFSTDNSDRPSEEDIIAHLKNGRFNRHVFRDFIWGR